MAPQSLRFMLAVGMVLLAAACDSEPEEPQAETIRPLQTFTVTAPASGQTRVFTAIIQPNDTSSLSFQVGGNVREVLVNQGEQVTSGQTLAVLDRVPYELNVQAARAALEQARAELAQLEAEYQRQRTLYEREWVARARMDNAERDFRSASSRVDYATARLQLAQRDLENTTLVAPFDGFIARRQIEPFVEVRPGDVVFEVDAEGGLEAAFGASENVIRRITLGMPATVSFPNAAIAAEAIITEIGSAAGVGNAFPVTAALTEVPDGLRPGMTAEVALLLDDDEAAAGYLVPLSAVAPGPEPDTGFVFVLDEASSTVQRREVRASTTLAGNVVAVSGIQSGEVIASAGVSFLVDGQRVGVTNNLGRGS